MVGWLASELGSATFVAVGEEMGGDVSTISSAVRRLKERTGGDAALGRRLDDIKAVLEP